jgi:hypothetical protein
MNEKLNKQNISLQQLLIEKMARDGWIDLTNTKFQCIGGTSNLIIMIRSVEKHLSGIKVKGAVFNVASVRQKDVKLQIAINSQTKEIDIDDISPGFVKNFSEIIANVPENMTQWAQITFIEANMCYNQY